MRDFLGREFQPTPFIEYECQKLDPIDTKNPNKPSPSELTQLPEAA